MSKAVSFSPGIVISAIFFSSAAHAAPIQLTAARAVDWLFLDRPWWCARQHRARMARRHCRAHHRAAISVGDHPDQHHRFVHHRLLRHPYDKWQPVCRAGRIRAFIMVGICGGFTTFSSFSLQTLELARGGRVAQALGNIAQFIASKPVPAPRLSGFLFPACVPCRGGLSFSRPSTSPRFCGDWRG